MGEFYLYKLQIITVIMFYQRVSLILYINIICQSDICYLYVLTFSNNYIVYKIPKNDIYRKTH